LYAARFLEIFKMFPSNRVCIVVIIDLLHKSGALWAVPPYCRKFIRRSWYSIFEALPHNTFQGTCHGGEEIGGSLSLGAIKSKVDEVVLCVCTSAEVDLTALIQNEDFVKDL
jgi:hypothetical protein